MKTKQYFLIAGGTIILGLLLVGIFINGGISNVFATEEVIPDDQVIYSNNDLKVTLKNKDLITIGTAELKSHKSVDEIRNVGVGEESIMWYKFESFKEIYAGGLGKVTFINMNTGQEVFKDYEFVYLTTEEIYNKVNGTSEIKEVWKPYNSRDIPKENITIGLKVNNLQIGEHFDIVWTIAGKEIDKHAEVLVVRIITADSGWSTTGIAAFGCQGDLIDANRDFWVTNVTKASQATFTRGFIAISNNDTVLGYSDFSGNTATFSDFIYVKAGWRIFVCGTSASSYTATYKTFTQINNTDFSTYGRSWSIGDGNLTNISDIYQPGQTGYTDSIISIGTSNSPTPSSCQFSGFVTDENNNTLQNANISIFNQNSPSEYYTALTDANGYWAVNITNSTNTYMAGAYINNTLIGQLKPYISGQC